MPPVRLLHAADLHLDGPVAAPDPESYRLAAQARAVSLQRLVKLADERRVQVVLLSGDVFHSPTPPLSAVYLLQEALWAWTKAGARVFIAPGNHDPWQPDSVWERWREMPGVHVFTPQPQGIALDDLGLWVAGAAHESTRVAEDLAAQLPGPPNGLAGVACLHADLPSSRESKKHQPYAPTNLTTLTEAGFAYWALGHWHKPQELSARPRVVMAGTPQGAHLDETGHHGAWLVEMDTAQGGSARAELIANAPLVFYDLSLGNLMRADDLAALVDLARELLSADRQAFDHEACLRLSLIGPSPLWRDLVGESADQSRETIKRALGLTGLVLKCGQLAPPVELEELIPRSDVLGGVLRLLEQAAEDDELLAELLETLGPQLHPWVKGWDPAKRRTWLRDLIPEARSAAIRDLWIGKSRYEA
jgi:exonuclease SbcD